MGVIVKDLNQGLVEFYSKLDNQDIFLCYKLNEKKIHYWHEIDSGCPERKSVSILQKDYEKRIKKLL